MTDINEHINAIREFADARNWGQFHTPKNLAMAIAGEAGELVAEFQWLTAKQSEQLSTDKLESVGLEMADIAIYLLRLSDVLNIDLNDYIKRKMTLNESRFPSS